MSTTTGTNRATRRAADKAARRSGTRTRVGRLAAGIGAVGLAATSAVITAAPASAAGLTVTTNADSGPGSLRAAIEAANLAPGADVITFDSGVTGTITLTSGDLDITGDLTITGPGAGALTISGGGTSRIFDLVDSEEDGVAVAVVISGLTLSGGDTTDGSDGTQGGAVRGDPESAVDLRLDHVVISGNTAEDGGGVYMHAHLGSVTILNSEISGNIAENDGGGLYLRHTEVTLDNVKITGNTAASGGGGAYMYETRPVMTNSVVSSNTANGAGGGLLIFSTNAALYDATPYTGPTIINSVISDNKANASGGGLASFTELGGGEGGDDYPDGPITTTTIMGTTISGNYADGNGGGILISGRGAADILDSTISGNTVKDGGGGGVSGDATYAGYVDEQPQLTVGFVNTTIVSNTARMDGRASAVSLYSTGSSFDHVTIAGNSGPGPALLLTGVAQQGGGEGGGPIEVNLRDRRNVKDGRAASIALPQVASLIPGTAALRNSIVVNPGSTVDISGGYDAGVITAEYSLIGAPGAVPVAGGGNLVGVDPLLGSLADNGGLTLTMLPATASPAVNAGNAAIGVAPALDQRGAARVSGPATDMGAVEIKTPLVATGPVDAIRNDGESVSFTAAATGDPVISVQWQVSTDGGAAWANVAGGTDTTLTFTALLEQDGTRYRAVFTNGAGSVTTNSALLTVLGLAKTGAEVETALPLGAALVAIGAAMTAFARRRRA